MSISLFVIANITTILLCVFILCTLFEWRYFITAKNWEVTTGRIIISRVDVVKIVRPGGPTSGTNFLPEITYEFEYEGRIFQGNRVVFGQSKIAGSSKRALAVCEAYPKDKEVNVFFDKDDPTKSVLNPSVFSGILSMGFISLCLSFIAALFWSFYYLFR